MRGCVPSFSDTTKSRCANAGKIALVVAAVLALVVVAILATLVNFNVLGDPLSSLNTIGQFGSGALVAASGGAVGYLAVRMVKACKDRRDAARLAAAGDTVTPPGEGNQASRSWLSYIKFW